MVYEKIMDKAKSKVEYNPETGKNVVTTNGRFRGTASGRTWGDQHIVGRVKEDYNPSTGRFELVDEAGRCVGYVPRRSRF